MNIIKRNKISMLVLLSTLSALLLNPISDVRAAQMGSTTVTFAASTSQSQSKTVTISNLKSVSSVSVNTGSATYSVSGNQLTVNVSGGTSVGTTEVDSGINSCSLVSSTNSFPAVNWYNDGTYHGNIPKSGASFIQAGTNVTYNYSATDDYTGLGYCQWNSSTGTMNWLESWYWYAGKEPYIDWTANGTTTRLYETSTAQLGVAYTRYSTLGYPPKGADGYADEAWIGGANCTNGTVYQTQTNYYRGTYTGSYFKPAVYQQMYSGTVYRTTPTYAYTVTVNYEKTQPTGYYSPSYAPTGAVARLNLSGNKATNSVNGLNYSIANNNGGGVGGVSVDTPYGKGILFSGGQIKIPTADLSISDASTNYVSVSFYLKSGETNVMPVGFNKYDAYLDAGWYGFNTAAADQYGIDNPFSAAAYKHIVLVFTKGDATMSAMYVNGVKQTLSQKKGAQIAANAVWGSYLCISGWANDTSYKLNGSTIAGIDIWNRALTATEVTGIYSNITPWTTENQTVTFTPYDNGTSGVNKWRYRLSSDGGTNYGAWSAYSTVTTGTPISLTTDGRWKIQAEVTDNTGTVTEAANYPTSGEYDINKEPGTAGITYPNTIYNRTFTINFANLINVKNIKVANDAAFTDGVVSTAVLVTDTVKNLNLTLSDLTPTINYGTRTFYVEVTDSSDVKTVRSYTVCYEAQSPNIPTITAPLTDAVKMTSEGLMIHWTYSDPNADPSSLPQSRADVEVIGLDNSLEKTYNIVGSNTSAYINDLPKGEYRFTVTVYNAMDKSATSSSSTFRVNKFNTTGYVLTKEITSTSPMNFLEVLTKAETPVGTAIVVKVYYANGSGVIDMAKPIQTVIHDVRDSKNMIKLPSSTTKIKVSYNLYNNSNPVNAYLTPALDSITVLAK